MIIVVEGASASGKTTWCNAQAQDRTIPESPATPEAPNRRTNAQAATNYWIARNNERWQAALAMERARGMAVCDSDPLKLHYAWSLFVLGEIDTTVFAYERNATRAAISSGQLGFADMVLLNEVPPAELKRRKERDTERKRANFPLHARLAEPLRYWYAALADLSPGRIIFGLPATLPAANAKAPRDSRSDVKLFDRLLNALEAD